MRTIRRQSSHQKLTKLNRNIFYLLGLIILTLRSSRKVPHALQMAGCDFCCVYCTLDLMLCSMNAALTIFKNGEPTSAELRALWCQNLPYYTDSRNFPPPSPMSLTALQGTDRGAEWMADHGDGPAALSQAETP